VNKTITGERVVEEAGNDEVNLLDYWRVIARWKWMIILVTLVSIGTSSMVTLQTPKIYRASTTILPLGAEGGGGLGAALSAIPFASGLSGAGIKTPADQLLVILKSRTLAEAVIQHLKLQAHYYPELWDIQKGDWKSDKQKPFLEDTVKRFQSSITTAGDRYGAVTIAVIDLDPTMAAKIANSMVSALAQFLNSRSLNINFQTIDPAVPPERKFKPSIRTNSMIAGASALFVGVFLAFFLEYVKRIREGESR
jgi:uncharacterized protein involved in exopolysaccharide biosynthesis